MNDAPDVPTYTAEQLGEGGFGEFRKTSITLAKRIEGPFSVETPEGTMTCEDGWLALDSDSNPYPIAASVFEETYEPAAGDPIAPELPERTEPVSSPTEPEPEPDVEKIAQSVFINGVRLAHLVDELVSRGLLPADYREQRETTIYASDPE